MSSRRDAVVGSDRVRSLLMMPDNSSASGSFWVKTDPRLIAISVGSSGDPGSALSTTAASARMTCPASPGLVRAATSTGLSARFQVAAR